MRWSAAVPPLTPWPDEFREPCRLLVLKSTIYLCLGIKWCSFALFDQHCPLPAWVVPFWTSILAPYPTTKRRQIIAIQIGSHLAIYHVRIRQWLVYVQLRLCFLGVCHCPRNSFRCLSQCLSFECDGSPSWEICGAALFCSSRSHRTSSSRKPYWSQSCHLPCIRCPRWHLLWRTAMQRQFSYFIAVESDIANRVVTWFILSRRTLD